MFAFFENSITFHDYPEQTLQYSDIYGLEATKNSVIVYYIERNISRNKEITAIMKSRSLLEVDDPLVLEKKLWKKLNHKIKNILIVCNPYGGIKTASQILQSVTPIFDKAHIKYKVIETAYSKHAYDLIKSYNLGDIDCIVSVSGDGLVHEIINGLMNSENRNVPVAIIPAGTSNCTSKSLNQSCPYHSAFCIVKGQTIACDLIAIEQGKEVIYSHMGILYGFIADIDLGGDRIRFLGRLKIPLMFLGCLIMLSKYKIKVSYLKEELNESVKNQELFRFKNVAKSNWKELDFDQITCFNIMKKPFIDRKLLIESQCTVNDGFLYLSSLSDGGFTRLNLVRAHFSDKIVYKEPLFSKKRTKAVKVEFLEPSGHLDCDGERIPFQSFYAECIPEQIRMIVPHGYNPEMWK